MGAIMIRCPKTDELIPVGIGPGYLRGSAGSSFTTSAVPSVRGTTPLV
jgi:hypothetical protein